MADKFCRDCDHGRGEGVRMTCASSQNEVEHVSHEKYLVTGEAQPTIKALRGASCTALRKAYPGDIAATVCGPEGKWFKAKESAS